MKMKISFAKKNGHGERTTLSSDDQKFFRLLTEIPELSQIVIQARQSCGLHSDGIAKMWPIEDKRFRKIDFARLIDISMLLTRELSLAPIWNLTILELILGLPLTREKSLDELLIEVRENEIVIRVKSKVSRKKLAEKIKNNIVLKKSLKKLPLGKIKVKKENLDRDLAIKKLRLDAGSLKEVADELLDKNENWSLSESEISKYHSRMTEYLNSIFERSVDPLLLAVEATSVEEVLEDT